MKKKNPKKKSRKEPSFEGIDEKKTIDIPEKHSINNISNPIILKVVGVSYLNDDGSSRQELIRSIKNSESVLLERDINNIHDKYAIKVTARNRCIGFISKEINRIISENLDFYRASVYSVGKSKSGTYGLSIILHPINHSESSTTTKNEPVQEFSYDKDKESRLEAEKKEIISYFAPQKEGNWIQIGGIIINRNSPKIKCTITWENILPSDSHTSSEPYYKFACVGISNRFQYQSFSNTSIDQAVIDIDNGEKVSVSTDEFGTENIGLELIEEIKSINEAINSLKNNTRSYVLINRNGKQVKFLANDPFIKDYLHRPFRQKDYDYDYDDYQESEWERIAREDGIKSIDDLTPY